MQKRCLSGGGNRLAPSMLGCRLVRMAGLGRGVFRGFRMYTVFRRRSRSGARRMETHRLALPRLAAARGAAASSAYCLLYLVCFLAWNNFAKAAALPVRRLLLIQKRQLPFVEPLKPFIPTDFLQRWIARTGKLKTNARRLAGTLACQNWLRSTLLCPAANCIMIGCDPRRSVRCHGLL